MTKTVTRYTDGGTEGWMQSPTGEFVRWLDYAQLQHERDYLVEELAERMNNVEFLQTWMRTENPMLGNIKPLDMLRAGKGNKLAQFLEATYELDKVPEDVR